jgi:WD40 repeat protein
VTRGECLKTLRGHSSWVSSVSFSPDGTKVASGTRRKLKLWDVTSGECLQTLEGYSHSVEKVSFSPDGSFLITARSVLSNFKILVTTYAILAEEQSGQTPNRVQRNIQIVGLKF